MSFPADHPARFVAGHLDDTPNSAIIKSREKPIGFHTVNTDAQIIETSRSATAGQVLDCAARLGKPLPPEKA
jgi:hypothetical protein